MRPLHRNAFLLCKPYSDVAPLVEEVSKMSSSVHWLPKSIAGGWSSITIKNKDGADGQFLTAGDVEAGVDAFQYTRAGMTCPLIRGLLESLGTRVYLVRLLRLSPGKLVKYHTDDVVFHDTSRIVRLHLPLVTNKSCVLRFGDPLRAPKQGYNVWDARQVSERHIPEGELWFTNVNALHSVFNGGETDRTHLVMDVEPQPALARALHSWGN